MMKYYYILLLMLLDTMLLMFLPKFGMGHKKPENRKITINLYVKNVKPTDTIFFRLQDPADPSKRLKTVPSTMQGGRYRFDVPVDDLKGFWYLEKRGTFTDKGGSYNMNMMTKRMFWVAGDSITMLMSYKETSIGVYSKLEFKGRGALKYTLQNRIDSIFGSMGDVSIPDCSDRSALFENPAGKTISSVKAFLSRYKGDLTDLEYGVLQAQAIYGNSSVFYFINKCYSKNEDSISKIKFLSYYKENIEKLIPRDLPDSVLANLYFIKFMFNKYRWEARMFKGSEDLGWIYESIKANESGTVRERLISLAFTECKKTNDFDKILADADKLAKDKYTKMALSELKVQSVGRELKDFVMIDTADKKVKLSDFRGKVVFLDFWGYGCGACYVFYRDALSKVKEAFHNNPAVAFISIGIDRKKERWLSAIESNMYTSKDAINLNTGELGSEHPALTENGINGTPTAILLDSKGRIVKFNTADLYNEKSLMAAINSVK
ncbi:TlpA family protein disulfide reductase [Pedobacter panaciterrae]